MMYEIKTQHMTCKIDDFYLSMIVMYIIFINAKCTANNQRNCCINNLYIVIHIATQTTKKYLSEDLNIYLEHAV